MTVRLLESLVTTDRLTDVFSDEAIVGAMVRFEVALALAEARTGVIPAAAAEAIATAGEKVLFDFSTIAQQTRASGTPAIPFVDALRDRVRVVDESAATFVHWGATSQDVTDTALVLCLRRARDLVTHDHERLRAALKRLSAAHAGSVMLARTLLQPAPPTTFGLKTAGWYGAISRTGTRLLATFEKALQIELGGASGTLAPLGADGLRVATELARELGLRLPEAPWHAHRDRFGALVVACGVYTASLGKIARDVSLLMQFEVGEAAEPGGGSSTMPHKRNPAGCAAALAAATRVPGLVADFLAGMIQEHERGLGGWHAEAVTLASVVQSTGAALAAVADVAETLSVDPARMRANIDATHGVVFAERATLLLARTMGRDKAARIVAAAIDASRHDGTSFVDALAANSDARATLSPDDLKDLGSPEAYLGSAEQFRRRLLE
jgi:3-carboxy-cis,cis-muconate cycloisomerase